MIEIRKGQAPSRLSRQAFGERYRASFVDPAFAAEKAAIARLEKIAWLAYDEGRKAPLTRLAGPDYADPTYALSVEWLATRQAIDQAQLAWGSPASESRVLLVCGSARNDGTCPGEVSKTGKFWAMPHLRISQPHPPAQVALATYAQSIGPDTNSFNAEMADGIYTQRVQEQRRAGEHSGVRATPTLFFGTGRLWITRLASRRRKRRFTAPNMRPRSPL